MSWLGVRVSGLSAPYLSQCAVMTDFAMTTTVEGDASICVVLIVMVHVRLRVRYSVRIDGLPVRARDSVVINA